MEPPGTPVTYGPPGVTPDPWVREGVNPSATPNGGLSFEGVLRNPLGVSHGSGAGLAGNPGWAGNPFAMQAPEGAGFRMPQREEAQGGAGGVADLLRLLSQYLLKEMGKENNPGVAEVNGQEKRENEEGYAG